MDHVQKSLSDLSRRRFLKTVGTIATGIMLPVRTWAAGDTVVDGGTFIVALSADPATLNPMLSQALPTFLTGNQILSLIHI